MNHKITTLLVACVVTYSFVNGAVLIDNVTLIDGGEPDIGGNGTVSDLDGPFQVAESFRIDVPTQISRVSWYGKYKGGAFNPPGPDRFSLSVFSLDSAQQIASEEFSQDLGAANRINTGVLSTYPSTSSAYIYSYSAEVINPTLLQPGEYAVSIANFTEGWSETWMFLPPATPSPETHLVYLSVFGDWRAGNEGQIALTLGGNAVPEPGTLPLTLIGVLLVVCLRRRASNWQRIGSP